MDGPTLSTAADIKNAFDVSDLRTFRQSSGLPYAVVSHNPGWGLISDAWFGAFEKDEQFREVLEFVCENFETGRYRLWLADLRHLNRSFWNFDSWLADVVFPRAIAGGLEREAVVLPRDMKAPPSYDVFGSASAALRQITDGRVRGFTSLDDAKRWLLDV